MSDIGVMLSLFMQEVRLHCLPDAMQSSLCAVKELGGQTQALQERYGNASIK